MIACGYAAKLDRTYLPPANAGTSGGSPGSLNTPLGPSGFGQPAGFGQPGANGGFNGATGKTAGPAFGGQQSGSNGFAAPSNQYGQPGPSGSASGQTVGPNFDAGFGAPSLNFGNQAQDYQRSQPQRAQASAEQSAETLRSDNQNDGETFSYSFETSNGISAEESGVATNGVQAQGAFAYSDDDGQQFRVQYTADENGYHPQGDHLPTSPPIPDEILKSIEENARAAASGTQEGNFIKFATLLTGLCLIIFSYISISKNGSTSTHRSHIMDYSTSSFESRKAVTNCRENKKKDEII